MNFTPEQITALLDKIIGKIEPIGENNTDSKRLENVAVYISVFDAMHTRIDEIAERYADSPRYSEKLIGEACFKHLDTMGICNGDNPNCINNRNSKACIKDIILDYSKYHNTHFDYENVYECMIDEYLQNK